MIMNYKPNLTYPLTLKSVIINTSLGGDIGHVDNCIKHFENTINLSEKYRLDATKYTIQPTYARKSIHKFSIRTGQRLGFKVILRKNNANIFHKRVLDSQLKPKMSSFTNQGIISLGLSEYHQLIGVSYNPLLTNYGYNIIFTFGYAGYSMRFKARSMQKKQKPINKKLLTTLFYNEI